MEVTTPPSSASAEAMLKAEVIVEAQIKKTESSEKVADAVRKLFGDAGNLRIEPDRVMLVSNDIGSLRYLKDQFRDRRVRSSARRLLLSNQEEGFLQTYLLLNKQAATVGIGALCDDPRESALGPIVLRLRSEELSRIIDWLTQGYDRSTTS
jgi:predicted RNA binding protein with dsRBD fold (UPF0201 family)